MRRFVVSSFLFVILPLLLPTFILVGLLTSAPAAAAGGGQLVWTYRASMGEYRAPTGAALLDGQIYVVGGITDQGICATVQVYDPTTDAFATKPDMPVALNGRRGRACSIDGKLYVVGETNQPPYTETVEIYDPTTDSWSLGASSLVPQSNGSVVACNGKIYLMGGDSGTHEMVATVEEYDPSTDSWTQKADMPFGNGAMSLGVSGGKIYSFGGWNLGGFIATVAEYDPATDTWNTNKTPMPTARGATGVVVAHDGTIHVLGGAGVGTLATVEEYLPATDSWVTRTPMLQPMTWPGVAITDDDVVYVFGGQGVPGPYPGTGPGPAYYLSSVESASLGPASLPNEAPVVNAGSGASIQAGETFTSSGSFTDPDSSSWTATVDYGDGSGLQSLALNPDKTFALSHTYVSAGDYTATVAVSDDGGATGTATCKVNVDMAPLPESASGPWPTFQHDPQHTGRSAYLGPTVPELKWRFNAPSYGGWNLGGIGSPVVGSDGNVYINMRQRTVFALSAQNASVMDVADWGSLYASYQLALGPEGQVFLAPHRAYSAFNYVVSMWGPSPWSFYVPWYNAPLFSPPTYANDTVYISSGVYLYALDAVTGSQRWATALSGRVYGAPAVGRDGVVYVGSDQGCLYALNPGDGSIRWQYQTNAGISTAPAIGADGTVYFAPDGLGLYALSGVDGALIWKNQTLGLGSTAPAIAADGTIIVGAGASDVDAVSSTDGQILWSYRTGGSVQAPIIDGRGTVFVGSSDGYLYALGGQDGSLVWRYPVGDPMWASALGPDGVLYLAVYDVNSGYALLAIGPSSASVVPTVHADLYARVTSGGTFTDSGSFTDSDSASWTATVDYGDGSEPRPLVLNPDKTFALNHTYAQEGRYTAVVSVTDDKGNIGTATGPVTVVAPPTANPPTFNLPGTAYLMDTGVFVPQGSSATISASGTVYIAVSDMGWTPEGTPGTASQTYVAPGLRAYSLIGRIGTGQWFEVGTETTVVATSGGRLYLAVNDEYYPDNSGSWAVTVTQLAPGGGPTVKLDESSSADEGSTWSEDGQFVETGSSSWTATVDYGDGSGAQPLILNADKTFTVSHSYGDEGTYTVTVSITDGEGATGSATCVVTVNDVPPQVAPMGDNTVNVGSPFNLLVSFTDAGTVDTHTALIDWGDGTTSAGTVTETNGSGHVSSSHTYATPGTYALALTVSETDGESSGTATGTCTVADVAPTVSISAGSTPSVLLHGGSVDLTGTFSDPGSGGPFTGIWQWGDGTSDGWSSGSGAGGGGSGAGGGGGSGGGGGGGSGGSGGSGGGGSGSGGSIPGHHVYTTPGTYTPTLTVTDPWGGLTTVPGPTFRVDAPPLVVLPQHESVGEGAPLSLDGSGSTDSDGTIVGYSWDLNGDGVFGDATSPTAIASFPEEGAYQVGLEVTDNDGARTIGTVQVVVNEVNPTVTLPTPSPINEGDTYQASGTFSDPSPTDSFTATVDYGDGSGPQLLTLEADRIFTLSHRYVDNKPSDAPYTITVKVTEVGGATGTAATQLTVKNVAPTIAMPADATLNEGAVFSGTGSFSDPGVKDAPWSATVDYGDGSGPHPLALSTTNTFSLSHVYLDNKPADAPYTLTITVTDKDGGVGTATSKVTVKNVPPTIGKTTLPVDPQAVNTNVTATAAFTDPGTLDTHTAIWDWGDGSTLAGTVTESQGSGSVSGSHLYAKAGLYTVSLTVTDKDGTSATASAQYVKILGVALYSGADATLSGSSKVESPPLAGQPSAATYVNGKLTTSGSVDLSQTVLYLKAKGAAIPPLSQFMPDSLVTALVAASQAAQAIGTTYNGLSYSGSGKVTFTQPITVKGNLTISGSGNYTFASVYVTGNVSISGSPTLSFASLRVGGSLSVSGGVATSWGPTYVAGNTTFSASGQWNLSLLVTGGALTMSGSQTMGGDGVGTHAKPVLLLAVGSTKAMTLSGIGTFYGLVYNQLGGLVQSGGVIRGSVLLGGPYTASGSSDVKYDQNVLNNLSGVVALPESGAITPQGATANTGELKTFTFTLRDGFGNPIAGRQVEWYMQGAGFFINDDVNDTSDPNNPAGNLALDVTDALGQATLSVKSYVAGEQIVHAKVRAKGINGNEGSILVYDASVQWFNVDVATFDDPRTPADEAVASTLTTATHAYTATVYGLLLKADPTLDNPAHQNPIVDTPATGGSPNGIFDAQDAASLGGILLVNAADLGPGAVVSAGRVVSNPNPLVVTVGGVSVKLSLVGGYTQFDWNRDAYLEPFAGVTGTYLPLCGKTVSFAVVATQTGPSFDGTPAIASVGSVSVASAITDAQGQARVLAQSASKGPQTVEATVTWPGNPEVSSQFARCYAKTVFQ